MNDTMGLRAHKHIRRVLGALLAVATASAAPALIGLATFAWDGETFGSLLDFVAQLSVVLWSLVLLTAVIRFAGMRIYRGAAARTALVESAAARTALVESAAPSAAAPTTVGEIKQAHPAVGQLADAGLVRLDLLGSPARVLVDASTKA